jgi:adenine-specific DNA-methyltransferase
MTQKQKLELTWIGKENRPRLEPRILLEDPEKSYHAQHRVTDNDLFDNRLIFGDNLLALKALEQEFSGRVKCACIDPPYNTGSAFQHYDDGVEHSIWLSLMRDRLEILRGLMAENGTIWVFLDDNEVHYFKVMMDELFGRATFVTSVVWRSGDAPNNDAKQFSVDHNTILVYSKTPGWLSNPLARTEDANAHYSNPDNDPNGPWFQGNLSSPHPRKNLQFNIISPKGHSIKPPANGWRWSRESMEEKIATGEIVFTKQGTRLMRKTYLKNQKGLAPSSLWDNIDETGHNRQAKYELKKLFPDMLTSDLFATPKPEKVIQRILTIATNPSDLVLDSFGGSGTTGAVAHKMGRRWIMAELEETCHTHIIPRLRKVVDGTDAGGITEDVNWKGGGGFRYYKVAPSLLEKDKWGQWVISKEFNAAMLAEAVCKLEGFTYAPSETVYWQHGHSTERDFIYVTTQHLSADQLAQMSDEVGPERTLLVLCAAFRAHKGGTERYPNLTVKKIPKQVLSRCEWGHDDYSLKVENLPKAPRKPGQMGLFGEDKQ